LNNSPPSTPLNSLKDNKKQKETETTTPKLVNKLDRCHKINCSFDQELNRVKRINIISDTSFTVDSTSTLKKTKRRLKRKEDFNKSFKIENENSLNKTLIQSSSLEIKMKDTNKITEKVKTIEFISI
jgi:hypothetical protein